MTARPLYDESLYRFDQAEPSYWEATAGPRDLAASPLSHHESCDVAIIGGGYTGLSAALHLARDHQIDVRLLEAGHIGWGASGRNGGFCSLGGTKLSPSVMVAKYGAEEARRYVQSQVEAVELVRALGKDEAIDFWPQGEGEFTVANTPAQFASLEADAEIQRDLLGLEARTLGREKFLEVGYESPEQHGALLLKPTFGLHPLRYCLGLARAAEAHGARLHPASQVLEWRRSEGRHLLVTAGGALSAGRVIVACNGFMPEHLHRSLFARTLPLQTGIIVTRPLSGDELAAQGWRSENPTIDGRHLFSYFRVLPDRRLLFGGRGDAVGAPAGAEATYRTLEARLGELWPAWRGIEITHRWRGLVCFTRALRPALGRFPDDPSVYFGFGYHGNGVNSATWAGRELAHWLTRHNQPNEPEPLHLPALVRGLTRRFPLPGLRRVYVKVGLAYYRLLDRL